MPSLEILPASLLTASINSFQSFVTKNLSLSLSLAPPFQVIYVYKIQVVKDKSLNKFPNTHTHTHTHAYHTYFTHASKTPSLVCSLACSHVHSFTPAHTAIQLLFIPFSLSSSTYPYTHTSFAHNSAMAHYKM